jgi:hypothetical protein
MTLNSNVGVLLGVYLKEVSQQINGKLTARHSDQI